MQIIFTLCFFFYITFLLVYFSWDSSHNSKERYLQFLEKTFQLHQLISVQVETLKIIQGEIANYFSGISSSFFSSHSKYSLDLSICSKEDRKRISWWDDNKTFVSLVTLHEIRWRCAADCYHNELLVQLKSNDFLFQFALYSDSELMLDRVNIFYRTVKFDLVTIWSGIT